MSMLYKNGVTIDKLVLFSCFLRNLEIWETSRNYILLPLFISAELCMTSILPASSTSTQEALFASQQFMETKTLFSFVVTFQVCSKLLYYIETIDA